MSKLPGLRLLLAGVLTFLFIFGLTPVGASSANISHAYHTTSPIPDGSIVSLDPQRVDYVEAANSSNDSRLLGVAVASDDSLLAVDAGSGTTQVATNGTVSVLVSTLNGDINVGDEVAASPFSGIGMKASDGSRFAGLAQTAFTSHTSGAVSRQVTDKSGKSHQVWVGYLRLAVDIGTSANGTGGQQLNSLQKLAKSLTGHEVSTGRVIVSLVITLIAVLSLSVLIYSSIYGSIISLGRNPLAKYSIFRTLGSVLGMAAATGLIASLTVFLLLR